MSSSGSRLDTTDARKNPAPTRAADLMPWTLANERIPRFSSPTVSAIALTTSLPTPDRNAVPAMKYGLSGNVIVASSLAIPFIYGGVVSGGSVTSSLLLFMAGTAFLSGVGREVVKAMADTVGDEKRGIRSFARVYGMRSAALLGAGFFLASVVSSLLPLVLISVSVFYRVGVVVPDVVFVYLAYAILRKPTEEGALKVKTRALLGMLLGLIVFIGGAF